MEGLFEQIAESAQWIAQRWPHTPRWGIVLGSGLGSVARDIEQPLVLPYRSIPHFPVSTVIGHKGQLVCGLLEGVPVLVMQGRFHPYEGYSLRQVTFPIRVMRALGAQRLVVTNASGGINPQIAQGDVVVIDDHINLTFDNPLVGVNDDRLGPRFPDMSQPYTHSLVQRALAIARRENFVAHRGVYVGVRGPNYEPRAEYRFLRLVGGDLVGMSTVNEVIVAVHASMQVLGLSIVSNVCTPESLGEVKGEDVVAVVERSADKVRRIIRGVIREESGR